MILHDIHLMNIFQIIIKQYLQIFLKIISGKSLI